MLEGRDEIRFDELVNGLHGALGQVKAVLLGVGAAQQSRFARPAREPQTHAA